MVIEAKTAAAQKKLFFGFAKYRKGGPFLSSCIKDTETGQTLLSGMGELHLEILRDRLLREYKLPVNVGAPQVSYRETLSCEAVGEGIFHREVAGEKHYAKVKIRLMPLGCHSKKDMDFKMQLLQEDQQKKINPYLKSVEQGCFEALASGLLAGYATLFVAAICIEVDFSREEEFSTLAFKNAAALATREAMKQGNAQLLEPIFSLELQSPEEFTGNLVGDLHARRGKVLFVESSSQIPQFQIIQTEAPLANLFGYATDVRSLSQGRASFSMRFLRYDLLPEKEKAILLSSH